MALKETKELVGLLASLGELGAAVADGIQGDEIDELVEAVQRVSPALGGLSDIVSEVANATDEDRADLKAYLKSDFDIADDQLEATVETVFNVVVDLSRLLSFLASKPEPQGPPAA